MSIPAWVFFSFWATISATFLKLGFIAFNRSHLSTSVPILITILLKNSLAISLCLSSTYPQTFAPHLDLFLARYLAWQFAAITTIITPYLVLKSSTLSFWYFLYYALLNLIIIHIARSLGTTAMPGDIIAINIDFIIKLSMYFINENDYVNDMEFFPMTVAYIVFWSSCFWSLAFDEKYEPQMSRLRQKRDLWKWELGEEADEFTIALVYGVFTERDDSGMLKKMIYRRRKWIQFAVGMMGTILFQNYF